eukprot:355791-Chlamydomonas_euryale.AAC.15
MTRPCHVSERTASSNLRPARPMAGRARRSCDDGLAKQRTFACVDRVLLHLASICSGAAAHELGVDPFAATWARQALLRLSLRHCCGWA